jgi:hypothetical protein
MVVASINAPPGLSAFFSAAAPDIAIQTISITVAIDHTVFMLPPWRGK